MNIDLIYQGQNYNFDLRKDVNIKYIQELASKLIGKDSTTFELLYKNTILSEHQNNTLLKEITREDNNISIIITTKDKASMLFTDKSKKLKKIKDINMLKNISNINGLKIMLNSSLTSPINSNNKNTNLSIDILNNKKIKNSFDYISENKVFEEVYNSKEKEIYSLMNILSEKIKEYDNVLYKNYKNNGKINNNEVSSYEKNIIEFKDKQITFLKKLINYFNVNESEFICGNISLNDFFLDLKLYDNTKELVMPNNNKFLSNNKKKKGEEKIKKTEASFQRNNNDIKKLPLLPNNKIKGNKYFLSQNNNTVNSYDLSENKSDFEDKKDIFKDHIFNSEHKNSKNKKLIKQKKENKAELLNKTENKEKKINSNIFKNNIINDKNNNSKSKNKYTYNKAISLSNTNDNTNTSQNTTSQGKMAKANIINNKKKGSKYNLLCKSKTIVQDNRMNTDINSKNKNRINALFEEVPHKLEVISNNSSEISDSNKESKNNLSKIYEEENNNFTRTKHNSKIKNKRIGNNIFDFLI